MFEHYGNEDLIIDNDDEGGDDDQVGSLMASHLTNEKSQFRDDLAKLMERALC